MDPMNNEVLRALIRMAVDGDMNAAHAVESEVELRGLAEKYAGALETVVIEEQLVSYWDDAANCSRYDHTLLFMVVHAAAEQRAQAALKVLGLDI
jgi:hypothetical protein